MTEALAPDSEISLNSEEVCCPFFKVEKWDEVKQRWINKPFLKDSVPQLFHIPLPGTYAKTIGRMWGKATKANAAPPRDSFLLIAHDPSPFRGELFMEITRDIPDADVVKLSGIFYSKVFEASFNEIPVCLKKMKDLLSKNHLVSQKDYVYFPYCPKCSKKYGHKYVVIISQVG
jgi:hypothetical protein